MTWPLMLTVEERWAFWWAFWLAFWSSRLAGPSGVRPGHVDIHGPGPGPGALAGGRPPRTGQRGVEVPSLEAELQPAVGPGRPGREPVEPGAPRVGEGGDRLGGEEHEPAGPNDVREPGQHGQVVGAVVEAFEEDGGVIGLGRLERQHVALDHAEIVRDGASLPDQGAELVIDLDGGDLEAGGGQVVGEIAPSRPELHQAGRRGQAVRRGLADRTDEATAGLEVVCPGGRRLGLEGIRPRLGDLEIEGRRLVVQLVGGATRYPTVEVPRPFPVGGRERVEGRRGGRP